MRRTTSAVGAGILLSLLTPCAAFTMTDERAYGLAILGGRAVSPDATFDTHDWTVPR